MIASILALADRVGELVTRYGKPAVAAGRAAIDLMTDAKEVLGESDQGVLQRRLDQLQREVNAHADRTIDSLGDG